MHVTQDAPTDWPRPIRSSFTTSMCLIMGLLTLLLLALAADRVRHGDLGRAAACLAGAGYLGHFAAQFLSGMRRIRTASGSPRPATNDRGESGVLFPHSSRLYVWILPSLVMTAIAAAALGVTLIRLNVPSSLILVIVCFAGAGSLLWLSLFIVRRGLGGLVLTPGGVYHRTGLTDRFTPWETITGVRVWNGPAPSFIIDFTPTTELRDRSSLGRPGNRPRMVCEAAAFREQTVPAYRAVRFYVENPGRRHEIGLNDRPTR